MFLTDKIHVNFQINFIFYFLNLMGTGKACQVEISIALAIQDCKFYTHTILTFIRKESWGREHVSGLFFKIYRVQ